MIPPRNKLPPNSCNILPPLAAQLLHHFTLSGKITPSLLHHFAPPPLAPQFLHYPLGTNYPLTLATFYPPCQPNSYIILPSPEKLHPHSYTILPPPPWHPNSYIILPPLNKLTLTLTTFYPLGSRTLTSFYLL